jgi:hypothetical protein
MNKTQKLKNLIIDKYGSIREFSKIVGIPSTTLTSSLDKGIGGMAVDRVIKVCELLNIDIKTFEPLKVEETNTNLTNNETKLLESYNKLNDLGKNEATKRVSELTEITKYINNDEISATTEKTATEILEAMSTTIAAHDDDLTAEEKSEMDRRILDKIIKRKK